MDYDRFIGSVQTRAHLPSKGDAVAATRATLTTLAERIDANEAHDLASQLPREIATYVDRTDGGTGERFSFGEFCHRVAEREHVDDAAAVFHARCVIETLEEAVSGGEIRHVMSELPHEFVPLFASGSRGDMRGGEMRH